MQHQTHTALLTTAMTLLLAASASTVEAQNSRDASGNAAQQDTTAVEEDLLPDVPDLDELRPGRITLLREGSILRRAAGHITRDEMGIWSFELQHRAADQPRIDLRLLPSRQLMEMERLTELDASAIEHSLFEVTGEVFVFRGRNYLLPTFAPRLTGAAMPPARDAAGSSTTPPAGASDDVSADDDGDAAATQDDSVKQIMQDLEESAGAIARAAPIDRTMESTNDVVRDGDRIVNRRGRVRRDERGAWVFVFDSDTSGLEDPPLTLLPCLLLEDLIALQQKHARTSGTTQPILISGTVTTYRNRRYLLPSMFRIPRNSTPISG